MIGVSGRDHGSRVFHKAANDSGDNNFDESRSFPANKSVLVITPYCIISLYTTVTIKFEELCFNQFLILLSIKE